MRLFQPGKQESYKEIDDVKNQIIDNSLIIGSILGLFSFIASLKFNLQNNYLIFAFLDFSVVVSFGFIAIIRKRLHIEIKSLIILTGLFILALGSILKVGVFADSKVLLILIPLFALLGYSLRNTIIIYSIALLCFIILAYLYISGIIESSVNLSQRALTISAWVNNTLLLTIVSIVIIIILRKFNTAFSNLITDLQNKNKEIAEKERNYREIFNSSTDAIFIHGMDGSIIDVNHSMLNMYGYNLEESISVKFEDLNSGTAPYNTEKAQEYFKKTILEGDQVFDWHARKKTGELFWVEVAMKKISVGDKDRILAVVRDISDKKQTAIELAKYRGSLELLVKERTEELELTLNELRNTQEQLIQSEKMASIGVLSAGIAHEINNPLNFIHGGILGIETYFSNNLPEHTEKVNPLITAINIGVKRATDIVASLSHYSRKDDLPPIICNIHDIIDNCLIMLQNQLKNKVEVKKVYAKENCMVFGNEAKLHQAILNILSNAEQAIQNKGIIVIQTEKNKKNAVITVTDSGSGISSENLQKVFDPFFTTKNPGTGVGLGLSIAYNIILEHQGTLEFKSKIGMGTEVIITLPGLKSNS